MYPEIPELEDLLHGVEILDRFRWALMVMNLPPMICAFYHGSLMTILWCWTLGSILLMALMGKMENQKLSAQIEGLKAAKEGENIKEEKEAAEVKEAFKAAQEVDWDVLDKEDL
jgi:hypothetical protein